jgi:hypothetical protein
MLNYVTLDTTYTRKKLKKCPRYHQLSFLSAGVVVVYVDVLLPAKTTTLVPRRFSQEYRDNYLRHEQRLPSLLDRNSDSFETYQTTSTIKMKNASAGASMLGSWILRPLRSQSYELQSPPTAGCKPRVLRNPAF